MTHHISLLSTGGTIATTLVEQSAVPTEGADQLRGLVDLDQLDLTARDVFTKSSRAITPEDMWHLAIAVREEVALGADGVVITHGTDTLEETAYALALVLEPVVPVVLTGSMRSPNVAGSDAPANLRAALQAATYPELAPHGPVVVLHDEIHAAKWVTKQHSARVHAFASPVSGPVGAVVEGQVELLLSPSQSDRLPRTAAPVHRVELLWAVAGADGLVVEAVVDKVDGLVVAGTGGGHVAPPMAEALVSAAGKGLPIVLSSRCSASGVVLSRTYGGVGSERHLLGAGIASAGWLSPLKARIRLLFGMAAQLSVYELFPTTEVSS